MMRRKETRADKAAKRVAEAIQRGVVLFWSSAQATGTIGPYRKAAGPPSFAIFYERRRGEVGPSMNEFRSSKEAAVTLVDQIGVTNAIDSLKKTGEYENLDTPFARDFRELFGAGRRK